MIPIFSDNTFRRPPAPNHHNMSPTNRPLLDVIEDLVDRAASAPRGKFDSFLLHESIGVKQEKAVVPKLAAQPQDQRRNAAADKKTRVRMPATEAPDPYRTAQKPHRDMPPTFLFGNIKMMIPSAGRKDLLADAVVLLRIRRGHLQDIKFGFPEGLEDRPKKRFEIGIIFPVPSDV